MESHRLILAPFTEEHFQAIFSNDMPRLGTALGINTPATWTTYKDAIDALPVFYEWFKQLGPQNPWRSYFVLHKKERELIGTGGYKGNPTEGGILEIGYEIKEAYRGQGIATEVSQILIKRAFADAAIAAVCAHTLKGDNASPSVLKKCGFTFAGMSMDPNDGEVCRWVLEKP